jgi:hypothetical protein
METEKNPFDPVRVMMLENLKGVRSATQSYVDLVKTTMRSFPNSNEEQISAYKRYVKRQVAANHAFVDKLLRAKDFQEALRLQVEYFQSQMKAGAEDAAQIAAKLVKASKS